MGRFVRGGTACLLVNAMTTLSVVPARFEHVCGHAALVALVRVKGESSRERTERLQRDRVVAAAQRSCDFRLLRQST